MKAMIVVVAFAVIAAPGAALQRAASPSLDAGREATRLLLAGDAPALARRMSPTFLAAVGGEAGVPGFIATVRAKAGGEEQVLEEAAFREGGMTSYYRRSRFEKLPDVTIRWVIDGAGVVHGGSVRPSDQPAASRFLDYRPHAALHLPFAAPKEGRWYVAWGGRDAIHNKHAGATDQRFATDLVVLKDDSPFRGDGRRNEDHYCFGEPILAPAAGRVVAAVDGIADNAAPGIQNTAHPAGNHVIIDHGRGEFSLLAHFRQSSVAVKPGQAVARGAALGQCGNSGKSTLPHLHYHLQTAPVFGEGEGLPAAFVDYRADGIAIARGEPVRGQRLEP